MTWGRLDDQMWRNERMLTLSPSEFQLYWMAISYCASEWPRGKGCLSRERALALARMARLRCPEAVVDALLSKGRFEDRPDLRMHIHDIERYMVHAQLSEKRSMAGRLGAQVTNTKRAANAAASAEQVPRQTVGTGSPVSRNPYPGVDIALAKANARALEGGEMFVRAWNAHCDPLPHLRKPPPGRDAQRLIAQALEHLDGSEERLGEAVARCALDEHYREKHYGFETFCRHIARWAEPGKPHVAPVKPPIENPLDRQLRERGERWGTITDMVSA